MEIMKIMENKLITPKEASNILGVTIDCLSKWEQAGKITAIKTLGGHRRYKLEEINKIKQS